MIVGAPTREECDALIDERNEWADGEEFCAWQDRAEAMLIRYRDTAYIPREPIGKVEAPTDYRPYKHFVRLREPRDDEVGMYLYAEPAHTSRESPDSGLAIESAARGSTWQLSPASADAKGPHPSHKLRCSDASTFDMICVYCDRTDQVPGGWGLLVHPCPKAPGAEPRCSALMEDDHRCIRELRHGGDCTFVGLVDFESPK